MRNTNYNDVVGTLKRFAELPANILHVSLRHYQNWHSAYNCWYRAIKRGAYSMRVVYYSDYTMLVIKK